MSRNCMFFSTTTKIQENLAQAYSMKDPAASYEVKSKIFNTEGASWWLTTIGKNESPTSTRDSAKI